MHQPTTAESPTCPVSELSMLTSFAEACASEHAHGWGGGYGEGIPRTGINLPFRHRVRERKMHDNHVIYV